VVDDEAVAVDAERARVNDLAVVRRETGTDEVTARSKPMDLLIDLLALYM
jgi:hypothetical protein